MSSTRVCSGRFCQAVATSQFPYGSYDNKGRDYSGKWACRECIYEVTMERFRYMCEYGTIEEITRYVNETNNDHINWDDGLKGAHKRDDVLLMLLERGADPVNALHYYDGDNRDTILSIIEKYIPIDDCITDELTEEQIYHIYRKQTETPVIIRSKNGKQLTKYQKRVNKQISNTVLEYVCRDLITNETLHALNTPTDMVNIMIGY